MEAGLPFYVSGVWIVVWCVDTRRKQVFLEFQLALFPPTRGCQQILLLGKRRRGDGKLLLILGHWVSLSKEQEVIWTNGSFIDYPNTLAD